MLAVHVSVTECDTGWTPVPDSVTLAGELVALLVTFTLPGMSPVADGVNVTLSVAVWPGVTICPDETPLAVYPAPEMVTFEIVTLEFPPLVKATGRMLLLPILTLEKFRVVWLALRISGRGGGHCQRGGVAGGVARAVGDSDGKLRATVRRWSSRESCTKTKSRRRLQSRPYSIDTSGRRACRGTR